MRCDRLQRHPTVCSKSGPAAQREYDAHHQRTQRTLQLFPINHATFVTTPILSATPPPDTRASWMQHEDNGSTRPRRCMR
jgi:hypothetical protein